MNSAKYYFEVLRSYSTQKAQNSYAQKGAKSINC
jgi:hypothetical protein